MIRQESAGLVANPEHGGQWLAELFRDRQQAGMRLDQFNRPP